MNRDQLKAHFEKLRIKKEGSKVVLEILTFRKKITYSVGKERVPETMATTNLTIYSSKNILR